MDDVADSWTDLVDHLAGGDVTPGQMFGSKGLRTGTRFFALHWRRGGIVLKLPPARLEALVEQGRGVPFEPMIGRRMGGWVVLEPTVSPADLDGLAAEARDHVAAARVTPRAGIRATTRKSAPENET